MSITCKILLLLHEHTDASKFEGNFSYNSGFSISKFGYKKLDHSNFLSESSFDLILLDASIPLDFSFLNSFKIKNKLPYMILYGDSEVVFSEFEEDNNFFGYINISSPPNIILATLRYAIFKIGYISTLEKRNETFLSSLDQFFEDSENESDVNLLKSDKLILEKSHELIQFSSWIYEESGKVFWSEEIYRNFGIKKKSKYLSLDDFLEYILPSYRIPFKNWVQNFFKGENQNHFEYQAFDSEGNLKYYESRGEMIAGLNSEPKYLLTTALDISNRKALELNLLASERFAQATIDALQGQIAVLDREFNIIAVNQSWKKFYENENSSVSHPDTQTNYFSFFNHTNRETLVNDGKIKIIEAVAKIYDKEFTTVEFEFPFYIKSEEKWFNVRISRFTDGSHFLLVEHELINKHKIVESRLRLMANVFKNAKEGIFITDTTGTILEVNETFSEITGYSRDEAIGNNPRMLKSGRQSEEFYTNLWRAISSKGHWYGEVWNRRKNGEVYAEMATISAVTDAKGDNEYYVAIFSDITWIKDHERQLKHIAHYDALTGLPNRVLLADRLTQAMEDSIRREKILTIAFLDLDGFKSINDTYGHSTGDEILIILSNKFARVLREGDTLARIGGDEFIAVITDLDEPHDCEPILNNLLLATKEPIYLKDETINVSASIGATIFPQDSSEGEQLLRHADQAMYLAKLAGKNCYHLFDISLDQMIKTRRESLEQIRNALHAKEFVLYYQPKVNMKTGQVIGVEALIRWLHPMRGLIPPSNFLPIIEEHAEAVELGEWVIAEALRQVEVWNKEGIDLTVSVNIGARQIQQSDFIVRLGEILRNFPALSPSKLELEILETSALEDIKKVSSVMQACKKMGVRFALDDFGTGYSSLTYLKHLPADILKIDQSFVIDMLLYPDDMAIVKGVLGLVEAFQREAIAEGVESIEHGKSLIDLGCIFGQGYEIAKPMPATEIPAWISSWKPDPAWLSLN